MMGRWLLVETLGEPATWSVLAVDGSPRRWKSLPRTVPARLRSVLGAAHRTGGAVDLVLPDSRHVWSRARVRAEPVLGPDAAVHAVHLWTGAGAPPPRPGAGAFLVDAPTRRVRARTDDLGPAFAGAPAAWTGPDPGDRIERFDGALDLVAAMFRSDPGTRWLGAATVRVADGPRTLLVAVRNGVADPRRWAGLAADITAAVPPQPPTVEAAALDLVRRTRPQLSLALLHPATGRLVRWLTAPLPGVRAGGALVHPADLPRLRAAARDGATLPGIRLAGAAGELIADLVLAPAPGAADFVIAQLEPRVRATGTGG